MTKCVVCKKREACLTVKHSSPSIPLCCECVTNYRGRPKPTDTSYRTGKKAHRSGYLWFAPVWCGVVLALIIRVIIEVVR